MTTTTEMRRLIRAYGKEAARLILANRRALLRESAE